MRRRWALALVLGLGGLGVARGAEPAGFWNRVLHPMGGRAEVAADVRESREAHEARERATVGGPSLAAQLDGALAKLQRRQEVCQKLREIAHDTGDDALWRKADQLDQRAWDVYSRQTGKLRSGGTTLDEALSKTAAPTRAAAVAREEGSR